MVASNKEYTLVGRLFDVQSGNSEEVAQVVERVRVREGSRGYLPSFRPSVFPSFRPISRVTQEILQQLVNHLGSCRFLGDEALQHVACLHRQIIGMLSIPFESNDVS